MNYLQIKGNKRLKGEIDIKGAKNIAVALIPATILNKGRTILNNVPDITDVRYLLTILRKLGCDVVFDNNTVIVDSTTITCCDVLYDEVTKLRGSYYLIGAMLSRFNKVKAYYPGGCNLGGRPINYHIEAFNKLGYNIKLDKIIDITVNKLVDCNINCHSSVGTTINVLFSIFNSNKKIKLINPSFEIEVLEVINYLRKIGAAIIVEDNEIIIHKETIINKNVEFEILFDRMEALTYCVIGALCGEIKINGIKWEYMENPLNKLIEFGVHVDDVSKESILIKKNSKLNDIEIVTNIYPGFPTDVQQPFTVLLTQTINSSTIYDSIFPKRNSHIAELKKMGANIEINDNKFTIFNSKLVGTEVVGMDLRGTASLLIAGLCASGVTKLYGVDHIMRGYDDLLNKLSKINADVKLIN